MIILWNKLKDSGGSGGKIGTVVLVAMGSQPSTPYTVGSKWFYNGKIYTATSTTTTDGGITPSYDTAYLYNGTYYYWDGSALQGADESNLVHISGTETITGNKTFSGSVALGDNASAQTKPTSDTSDAVATTQFVKDFVQDGEWQKPADWIDIRSGALSNSITFLVAHNKPTGTPGSYVIDGNYPKFSYRINLSTAENTYDVFVDGIKVATTASGTATEIDWATLYNNGTLLGGYDIQNPGSGALTTHIVRFMPTVSTDTIVAAHIGSVSGQNITGILWMHLELDNEIKIAFMLGDDNNRSNIVQAVTAKNNKIKFICEASGNTGLYSAFYGTNERLYKIPELEANTNTQYGNGGARRDFNNLLVKKITIKNNSEKLPIQIIHNFKGQYLETENPLRLSSGASSTENASNATNLKILPALSTTSKSSAIVMERLDSAEPFFIDDGFNDERIKLVIGGASGHITRLIGLIVSNSAPFSGTTPQINVHYTAMDRAALVRLFNSMPTVSDSQEIDVTGATGAGDLTAEDIAIATGKGWTVVR